MRTVFLWDAVFLGMHAPCEIHVLHHIGIPNPNFHPFAPERPSAQLSGTIERARPAHDAAAVIMQLFGRVRKPNREDVGQLSHLPRGCYREGRQHEVEILQHGDVGGPKLAEVGF